MTKPHRWAQARRLVIVILALSGLGTSAAYPTDAPELPSSQAAGQFHIWKNMHPSSYTVDMNSVREQCDRAVPTENWLTAKHCELLPQIIAEGQCQIVMVPDGIKLDRLLGRVNGDPKGESRPWPRQEKQTGRLDRALLCDLGDGVSAYWFTGDPGRSCNNVGFVYVPPPEIPLVLPRREMRHTGNVPGDGSPYVPSVHIRCGQCDLYLPSAPPIGNDVIQSIGSTPVDW